MLKRNPVVVIGVDRRSVVGGDDGARLVNGDIRFCELRLEGF
jgi:hypothetical protein